MGYFDALTSGAFKTDSDGRRLFFPWGVLGRGYLLASERDYERLQRQIKTYIIVALVLIIGTGVLQAYIWSVVAVALLMAFYVIWAMYLLRGLQPSDERLSLEESLASQAIRHNATVLWLMQIGSLVFVATGILMLVLDPGNWLIALASTAFFWAMRGRLCSHAVSAQPTSLALTPRLPLCNGAYDPESATAALLVTFPAVTIGSQPPRQRKSGAWPAFPKTGPW